MELKFKILSADSTNNSIVVRYYSSVVTEEVCGGRTDFNISLPVPVPVDQALNDLIVSKAPTWWLQTQETLLATPVSLSNLDSVIGTEQSPTIVVPIVTLTDVQTSKIIELVNTYYTYINSDIEYTTVGGVKAIFQADNNSQSLLSKEMLVYTLPNSVVPIGYYWIAADNTRVPFTLEDLQGLTKTIGDRGWIAFDNLQTKKAGVLTIIDTSDVGISDVKAITF